MTDSTFSPAPVMGITSDVSPNGLVAPGQEELAAEFLREQESGELTPEGDTGAQQEEQELLLGKFRSQEDLARAYQELERKLGRGEQAEEESEIEIPDYSRDESLKQYGELLTDKFEEAGVNPFEMAARFEAGEDLSGYVDKLEGAGIPRPVIEQYLSNAAGDEQPAAEFEALSEQEVDEFKAQVGGAEAFQELTDWAKQNLTEAELASYNQVVDSGNRQAIFWALRSMSMQAAISKRAGKPTTQAREPKLIGGSTPSDGMAFESMGQVLEAMQKRNSLGQVLYETDDAYRAKVDSMVARSDFF